jgi:hypothetical protein
MKMLGKYIILYFEIDMGGSSLYVSRVRKIRRVLENNKVSWQFYASDKWSKCDESFRPELRPSVLESNYVAFMRTQKLERILNE